MRSAALCISSQHERSSLSASGKRDSPTARAEGLTTPVLLIHGRDDTVVPLEQSVRMDAALKAAAAPSELMVMNAEDHWLSRGETRLRMLNAVVNFLEKNNPPG